MRVIESEASLDAEPFVIGRSVAAFDPHDAVVLDVIRELAADAAVRTERRHLAIGGDQVCVVSGECRNGQICTRQTCPFGTTTRCGLGPSCNPAP